VSNSDLKWPSTTTTNPLVGGLSARGAFFCSGSSIERTGFFIGGATGFFIGGPVKWLPNLSLMVFYDSRDSFCNVALERIEDLRQTSRGPWAPYRNSVPQRDRSVNALPTTIVKSHGALIMNNFANSGGLTGFLLSL